MTIGSLAVLIIWTKRLFYYINVLVKTPTVTTSPNNHHVPLSWEQTNLEYELLYKFHIKSTSREIVSLLYRWRSDFWCLDCRVVGGLGRWSSHQSASSLAPSTISPSCTWLPMGINTTPRFHFHMCGQWWQLFLWLRCLLGNDSGWGPEDLGGFIFSSHQSCRYVYH